MPRRDRKKDAHKQIDARKIRNEERKSLPKKSAKYKDEKGELREAVNGLEEGQVFDNLPALFDCLDVYWPSVSNSKAAAMKLIEKYALLDSVNGSQKITIKEIYNKPIKKKDKRIGKSSGIYSPLVKDILVYYLSIPKDHELEWTRNELWRNLGMRNEYYFNYLARKYFTKLKEDISNQMLNNFFMWTWNKCKKITDYALKSLKRRGIIDYEELIEIEIGPGHYRTATPQEEQKIENETQKELKEWELKSESEAYKKGKALELYKEVCKNTKLKYRHKYWIRLVDEDLLNYATTVNVPDTKRQLNDNILKSELKSAAGRVENEFKKIERKYKEDSQNVALGKPNKRQPFFLYIDDYVEYYVKLEEYFTVLDMMPEQKKFMQKLVQYAKKEEEKKQAEMDEK